MGTDSFKIAGKPWKVVLSDKVYHRDGDQCKGLCHESTRIIELDRTLPWDQLWETFLHELAHACFAEYYHEFETDRETERVCDIVGSGFADALTHLLEPFKHAISTQKN